MRKNQKNNPLNDAMLKKYYKNYTKSTTNTREKYTKNG